MWDKVRSPLESMEKDTRQAGRAHLKANSAWCVSSAASRPIFQRSKSSSTSFFRISLIEPTKRCDLHEPVRRNLRTLRELWSSAGGLRISLRAVRRSDPREPVARDHVDDPQSDVDRVIRDPLEIPVHEDVPGAALRV